MGKIKIGIGILTAITLIGLVLGLVVLANSSNGRGSDNGRDKYAPDQIIVKFKGDLEPFRVVNIPEGKIIEKVKEYRVRADVIYAEPDYLVYTLGSNDKAYINQWALDNTGQTIYKGSGSPDYPVDTSKSIGSGATDADIDWEEAWNGFSTFTFADVTIAVIDSGIDETHPDLKNKIWKNDETAGNKKDDDGNGFIDDTWGWDFVRNDNSPHDKYGHGTHVSGIAAAQTNNGIGIAGVAFPANIRIMPIQVLNDQGIGFTSNVAKGIRYAADNGAKVINLSLGGGDSTTLKDAVNYAWGKGVVLAAAAGNDGNTTKYYPASYPNVISVAATDYNDNTASFSNYNNEVDVAAPGVDVFSTFPTYRFAIGTKYGRARYYDVGSGTSMSVPQVVGLAGLLFAQNPNRTNSEVRNIIEATADDLGALNRDDYFGYGRINVFDALKGTK